MKMMNKTEQKAYEWLGRQGHTGIVFNGRTSPDFATESGIGFEIKKARNGTVVFSDSQWEALEHHPHVKVVIFDDADYPLAVVEFKELPMPPSYWRQFRLLMNRIHQKALDARVEKAIQAEVRRIANEEHRIFTPLDVAVELSTTVNMVRLWLRLGDLRGFRLSPKGRWRIPAEALDDFIRKGGHPK